MEGGGFSCLALHPELPLGASSPVVQLSIYPSSVLLALHTRVGKVVVVHWSEVKQDALFVIGEFDFHHYLIRLYLNS